MAEVRLRVLLRELAGLRSLPLTWSAFDGAGERFVRVTMDLVTGRRVVRSG